MTTWLSRVVLAAAIGGTGFVGLARGADCPGDLAAVIASYVTGSLRAVSACENGRAAGTLPAETNCRRLHGPITHAPTAQAVAALVAKAEGALAGCSPPPAVGVACDGATTGPALAACITAPAQEPDTAPASADLILDTVFGTAVPIADPQVRLCLRSLAQDGARLVRDRMKLARQCRRRGQAVCPDARTLDGLVRARERFVRRARRRCTEASIAPLGFGPPCDRYRWASFERSQNPVTPNDNARPLIDRAVDCLADAHATTADRLFAIAHPDPEPAAFPDGVAAGDATDTAVVLWTRLAEGTVPVTLELAADEAFTTDAVAMPAPVGIFGTVKVDVSGLAPSTAYYYRFRQGGAVSRVGRIETLPPPAQGQVVRVGWVSGADAYHRPFTALHPLAVAALDAVFVSGDTIEAEDTRSDGVVARVEGEYLAKHRRVRADASLRNLLASAGTYAQWDDGEVSNDWAAALDVLADRITVAGRTFVSHYPIRETLGPERPPYRAVRFGSAVELFLLDARSYRSLKYTCCNAEGFSGFVDDDVDDTTTCISLDAQQIFALPNCLSAIAEPSRTILGTAQRAWLEQALLASTAMFKLIVGGPPIMELIVDRYDRWEGWPTERAEILNFIHGNDLANVIWLTTDMRGVFVADVRVDATHRVPEVVNGTFGTDTWIRSVFPQSLIAVLESGVIPSIVGHVTAWEGDRSLVAIVTIDPVAVPPSARFDFLDRTGAVVRTQTFTALE